MTSNGDAIEPDTKDWTWVLERPCPDCGFDASAVHRSDIPDHIRRDAANWVERLQSPEVTVRPAATVWSVLEYGCHVRDVHRIFDHRLRLMLTEDGPLFPNWDQDETALADDYAAQVPATVADELLAAANAIAETYAGVHGDAWSRRGLRSNGSEFSVGSIALYHLHDIVHHAWDVTPNSGGHE
jgi:DinB superfamily